MKCINRGSQYRKEMTHNISGDQEHQPIG